MWQPRCVTRGQEALGPEGNGSTGTGEVGRGVVSIIVAKNDASWCLLGMAVSLRLIWQWKEGGAWGWVMAYRDWYSRGPLD